MTYLISAPNHTIAISNQIIVSIKSGKMPGKKYGVCCREHMLKDLILFDPSKRCLTICSTYYLNSISVGRIREFPDIVGVSLIDSLMQALRYFNLSIFFNVK